MTENKTRDVSDRLLPLERLTCTRTSCVPSSLSRLSPGGYPVESWAPRNLLGKQVFHDTWNASADRRERRTAIVPRPRASPGEHREIESGRGFVLPTALAIAIEPLTPLSPLPAPLDFEDPAFAASSISASLFFSRVEPWSSPAWGSRL